MIDDTPDNARDDDDDAIDMCTGIDAPSGERLRKALAMRHTADALRRRALLSSDAVWIRRDPKDVAGAIALGFVLRRRGLGAADSWRLDGLLGESAGELIARLTAASHQFPDGDAGAVLVRAIDLAAAELAAKGEYLTWKRRADRYFEEHEAWLAANDEMRATGGWRNLRMTMGQQDLIRATCALLEIDLPGHFMRGSAHDWLNAARANLRYRGIGA